MCSLRLLRVLAAAAFVLLAACAPCPQAHPAAVLPFRFIGKHIVVDAFLDGKGPFAFLVDTGGVNLITPALQARLRLGTRGHEQGHGVGGNTVESGKTLVPITAFGGLTFARAQYYVYPFDAIYASGGVRVDGMVGNEIFRRFVMQIDYGAQVIRLYAHDAFDPHCSGTPVKMTSEQNELFVPGAFDGLRGRFRIDTGSGATLDIDQPFVRAHQLLRRFPHRLASYDTGVGGSVPSAVVRGHVLEIGSLALANPITGLSLAARGNFARADVAGNIGNGALAHFIVTLDYADRMLYLSAASNIPRGLNSFDRSGIVLQWAAPNFLVSGIESPSPAAQAGIHIGDVITAIDGKPASAYSLLGLRALLAQSAPGSRVRLALRHGPMRRLVTLRLRDLLP